MVSLQWRCINSATRYCPNRKSPAKKAVVSPAKGHKARSLSDLGATETGEADNEFGATSASGRPRRSGGRSLYERNPDFHVGDISSRSPSSDRRESVASEAAAAAPTHIRKIEFVRGPKNAEKIVKIIHTLTIVTLTSMS